VDNRAVNGDPLAVEVDVFHRHGYGLFLAEPGEGPERCDVAQARLEVVKATALRAAAPAALAPGVRAMEGRPVAARRAAVR
jgi:hypothetical protein